MRSGVLMILLIAGSSLLHAQGTSSVNLTTTAVPFLRINPDARGGAMGDAGIATTPDANSGLYNLAKTPFTAERSGLAVNFAPWLRDITPGMYLLQASGYHRLDTLQALSASVRYFSLGDVSVTDFNGNPIQNSQPREYALDLGYARKLAESLSLALTIRYIHSHLASGNIDGTTYQAGNAFATDISLFYHKANADQGGFSAGLALSNLGTRISYASGAANKDYLPANLGIGLAYTFVFNDQNKLLLTADGNKLVNSQLNSFGNAGYGLAGGAEYSYDEHLFLRSGYYWEDKTRGDQHYLTAGIGIRYGRFSLNFSYLVPSGNGVTRNPLSNTYRFGLLIN